jgi:dTDP-4-amino-4,6-dideoxygalactose transaminase
MTAIQSAPMLDQAPARRPIQVPFYRPQLGNDEAAEVLAALRSGWLTSGPRVRRFEEEFAAAVRVRHAIAVNSCTAALHLAMEALGLGPGQAVLVPTMTFAATAEVVRYQGAVPILVDCDPVTGNMNLADAAARLEQLQKDQLPPGLPRGLRPVGIIPVHVGGLMMDLDAVHRLAAAHGLWVVEDAAHAFPAAWRSHAGEDWQYCGQNTAAVTCFSFYANKTITTGEGGMAVTARADLADRMRLMSLHGLSHDAWGRYAGNGNWDYQIVAPGFKYNLTDLAAAIGIHQLTRAEEMRLQRAALADQYRHALAGLDLVELPPDDPHRLHAWHLFPIRLRLDRLAIDRNEFLSRLKSQGVGCSVHWRPLHLHPYYRDTFGWRLADLPAATSLWPRLLSLPLFPGMTDEEIDHVIGTVRNLCLTWRQ